MAHGLGLLAVTAMAVTGVVIFVLLQEYARPSATAHGFMAVHSFFAPLARASIASGMGHSHRSTSAPATPH